MLVASSFYQSLLTMSLYFWNLHNLLFLIRQGNSLLGLMQSLFGSRGNEPNDSGNSSIETYSVCCLYLLSPPIGASLFNAFSLVPLHLLYHESGYNRCFVFVLFPSVDTNLEYIYWFTACIIRIFDFLNHFFKSRK